MAQITRHRLASFDVQSQRYVKYEDLGIDDMYYPQSFTAPKAKSREGLTDISPSAAIRLEKIDAAYAKAIEAYNYLVAGGVPAEDARMVLPNGMMTNIVMSMNLRSLLHLFNMRGTKAGDAQSEIRELTMEIERLVFGTCPIIGKIWREDGDKIVRQRLSP